MTIYPFELTDEINLIIVIASIDGYELRLALDTGASDTVIDLTALLIAGYQKTDAQRLVDIETGKGIIQAKVYEVVDFQALGVGQKSFSLCSYDFLADGILTDIDGVLGLDFFRNRKLCIDFNLSIITVQ